MTMTEQATKLAQTADDAIEHARYCTEQARWLNALAVAICDTLEDGKTKSLARVLQAKDLASLASYLAYDLTNYSDQRANEMQKQLDAAQE
ncbi:MULTISPECIES: hypothetical protein [Pseudomonas aeruginosa group]|uniref:hypothetical protein n=1 Tax=Pseudomonas aeruginosa group TaxID=136841 RepID=UPI001F04B230|nr:MULTISPECIES: hypothetical protein [Pseudomonas aeruginosa group]